MRIVLLVSAPVGSKARWTLNSDTRVWLLTGARSICRQNNCSAWRMVTFYGSIYIHLLLRSHILRRKKKINKSYLQLPATARPTPEKADEMASIFSKACLNPWFSHFSQRLAWHSFLQGCDMACFIISFESQYSLYDSLWFALNSGGWLIFKTFLELWIHILCRLMSLRVCVFFSFLASRLFSSSLQEICCYIIIPDINFSLTCMFYFRD